MVHTGNSSLLCKSRPIIVTVLTLCTATHLIMQKYDRRSCRVLRGELDKWQDIIPTMMSDEEDVGNNTFRVHRQEWRSQEMNDFLDELDQRAESAMKSSHPRKSRVVGTPVKMSAPEQVKPWMVVRDDDSDDSS